MTASKRWRREPSSAVASVTPGSGLDVETAHVGAFCELGLGMSPPGTARTHERGIRARNVLGWPRANVPNRSAVGAGSARGHGVLLSKEVRTLTASYTGPCRRGQRPPLRPDLLADGNGRADMAPRRRAALIGVSLGRGRRCPVQRPCGATAGDPMRMARSQRRGGAQGRSVPQRLPRGPPAPGRLPSEKAARALFLRNPATGLAEPLMRPNSWLARQFGYAWGPTHGT